MHRLFTSEAMGNEKRREILRDGGIWRIRQSKLLKPRTSRRRLFAQIDAREETLKQQVLPFLPSQLDLHRAGNQLRSAAWQADGHTLRRTLAEQRFLQRATC